MQGVGNSWCEDGGPTQRTSMLQVPDGEQGAFSASFQASDPHRPPPQVLAPCAASINLNESILKLYLEHLMPEITEPGDDGNYGSAAMYDVMILQV